MPDFLLPDLGEGLTEAEIVTWHVQVGDTVRVDQIVVDVETAKAVVEVPVPFAGRVTGRHARPGESVAVGAPLITVAAAGPTAAPGIGSPTAGAEDAGSGNVLIGYGTPTGVRRRRRGPAPGTTPAAGPVAVVSPLVRRLAREAGIDLQVVHGSGADGLITRRDVDLAILGGPASTSATSATSAAPEPTGPEAAGPAPAGAVPARPVPAGPGAVVRIPLRGIRRAVADKLSRSRREIPEATVWVDVDATDLLAVREQMNRDPVSPRIGVLALVARFAVVGLQRFPELNARVEDDEIVMGPAVHLGFAAQTERGLVVPVVPDAQSLSLQRLSAALGERTERARAGRLAPAELTGGTFTINNYGVFGVDGSAAIINHPEVAILGLGRIIDRPWVVAGAVVPRRVAQLTLAFDHRVCDGATAGGFLRFVADGIESPATTLRYL